MNVLHLTSGNLWGGVENMLVTLARVGHLAPDFHSQFGVAFPGRLADELTRANAAPLLLGPTRLSRPWSVRATRQRLLESLSDRPPDIVIGHGVWSHVVFGPAVRAAHLPLVLFLHDATRGKHWLERWAALSKPDLVLANSRFTASESASLYDEVPSAVYHCPVEISDIATPEEREQTRAKLGIKAEQVVVIQASRLEPWKGHRAHLRALAELRGRSDWVSLQVGGPQRPFEQDYYDELRRLARELGIADRVHFLGQRSDARRLIAAADIHLQPNEGPEPFGIAFVEAMLAGLPVVSYAIGALPELIGEGEGLLVQEPHELVTSLSRLMDDLGLRRTLGSKAREKAVKLVDPVRQLPALRDLLAEMGPLG
jgi:glycosyltransferase involved in cell wall biosynthesis